MVRKLVAPLLIVALCATASGVRAADNQSIHCRGAAPAAAGAAGSTQNDDLRLGVKADGLPSIGTGSIDLVSGETNTAVTTKAMKQMCVASYQKANCSRTAPAPTCSGNISCCDTIDDGTLEATLIDCPGIGGKGYTLSRFLAPDTITIGLAALPFPPAIGAGNITNVTGDTRDIYTDLGIDIAPKSLIQIRPNGVTGTVQIRIWHDGSQGAPNPRVANVTVNTTNNDPIEASALHLAIETALEAPALALNPAIVATTHPLNDAITPLTAFGFLKQASNFTEITNITAVHITEVEVVVPDPAAGQPRMGFTVEGSQNTTDGLSSDVPTLNTWGIVVLVAMLLLAGYVLKRRQSAGTATT
jgi:hypothetical protein